MSLEIAWKQNILVTDFHLLKSMLVVFGFGLQAFICEFSRQTICSVAHRDRLPHSWFSTIENQQNFSLQLSIQKEAK